MSIKPCDCRGWRENEPKLNSCITIAVVHGHTYTGEQYSYCPWCGRCLVPSNCSHQVIRLVHLGDDQPSHICETCSSRVVVKADS